MKAIRKVLVIKLSAVGDFVLAFPAFERIRAAHRDAKITLLTTPPFEGLASDVAAGEGGHFVAVFIQIGDAGRRGAG